MMTVLDEPQNRRKYEYLVYVEFLEMLCRICIKGLDPEYFTESIAWKVQYIVEQIYRIYVDRGLFDPDNED